ncbi:MAG: helix-turn-helix domain-containing protein [Bacteroidales bacterium]|nr:helix-turn-helix domain-containing protein [Bacteroidales bacterium]
MDNQNTELELSRKISRAVGRWLKGQGITQQQAADMLGLSRSAVSSQLSYKAFSPKVAARWSAALGLNVKFLLTGEGPITCRQSGYRKVVNENDTLRCTVKKQEATIASITTELNRYKTLFGPLPSDTAMQTAI